MVRDWTDVTAESKGIVGDIPVGGKADTKDVSDASHLEAFETAKLAYQESPAFGTVEKGWKHSCLEDTDLGLSGDL